MSVNGSVSSEVYGSEGNGEELYAELLVGVECLLELLGVGVLGAVNLCDRIKHFACSTVSVACPVGNVAVSKSCLKSVVTVCVYSLGEVIEGNVVTLVHVNLNVVSGELYTEAHCLNLSIATHSVGVACNVSYSKTVVANVLTVEVNLSNVVVDITNDGNVRPSTGLLNETVNVDLIGEGIACAIGNSSLDYGDVEVGESVTGGSNVEVDYVVSLKLVSTANNGINGVVIRVSIDEEVVVR